MLSHANEFGIQAWIKGRLRSESSCNCSPIQLPDVGKVIVT
jgi:hypothetical protein